MKYANPVLSQDVINFQPEITCVLPKNISNDSSTCTITNHWLCKTCNIV